MKSIELFISRPVHRRRSQPGELRRPPNPATEPGSVTHCLTRRLSSMTSRLNPPNAANRFASFAPKTCRLAAEGGESSLPRTSPAPTGADHRHHPGTWRNSPGQPPGPAPVRPGRRRSGEGRDVPLSYDGRAVGNGRLGVAQELVFAAD